MALLFLPSISLLNLCPFSLFPIYVPVSASNETKVSGILMTDELVGNLIYLKARLTFFFFSFRGNEKYKRHWSDYFVTAVVTSRNDRCHFGDGGGGWHFGSKTYCRRQTALRTKKEELDLIVTSLSFYK